MKLTIGEYEVEIKAKIKGQKRYSLKETLNYLCDLEGMYYSEANRTLNDYPNFSRWLETIGYNIHDELDKHGYYDEYKNNDLDIFD